LCLRLRPFLLTECLLHGLANQVRLVSRLSWLAKRFSRHSRRLLAAMGEAVSTGWLAPFDREAGTHDVRKCRSRGNSDVRKGRSGCYLLSSFTTHATVMRPKCARKRQRTGAHFESQEPQRSLQWAFRREEDQLADQGACFGLAPNPSGVVPAERLCQPCEGNQGESGINWLTR
jgi:hypothetical protein